MQRPSAQGIADLFRGNPAPLQQRIQMEQQGKPGLPPDLQKLIALNLVTNEKDAMAREQAMSQLAKMQGQQGKPPTVLESVQEQARQKMQAQQVQAQRQQQAIQAAAQQAGPGPVPPGTPQPEAQPQGIDDLPVEFGLAGGGIVAFQNRGSVPEPEEERSDSPRTISLPKDTPSQEVELIRMQNPDANVVVEGSGDLYGKIARTIGDALTYSSDVEAMKERQRKASAPSDEGRTAAQNRSAINASDAALRSMPGTPAPVKDIKALAERQRVEQAPRPAPAPAKMAPEEEYLRNQFASMDPERARNEELRRFRELVPAPDTTQRDAAIKALQEERRRYAEPEGGFAGLMEYLGQIAATPRGMSSFEAGAAGARGVQALQKQRADQRMELGMKIIEQEQGKLDTLRAYGKETYGVGKKEFDQIFGEKLKIAGDLTKDNREKQKLAQEMTIKQMELRARGAEEAGRASRDVDSRLLQGYIDAAGGDIVKAHQNMAKAQGKDKPSPYLQELMKSIAEKEVALASQPKNKLADEARAQLNALKREAGILGGTPTGGVGGAVTSKAQYDALPKGASYVAPDGTTRIKG